MKNSTGILVLLGTGVVCAAIVYLVPQNPPQRSPGRSCYEYSWAFDRGGVSTLCRCNGQDCELLVSGARFAQIFRLSCDNAGCVAK